MMDSKTIDRLLKLLALTTSEADGEALNAIRMANALLKKNNLQWADILAVKGGKAPVGVAGQSSYEVWQDLVRRAQAQQSAAAAQQQRAAKQARDWGSFGQ